ncbi:glycine cleavage system protein GcvH [Legionella oakridgensis]|uniref:Glycine cleavage system H protein n=2 Tax=Legionella oakridgensis TaxID=29423 RepID=W0BBD0_9GAMM|nr:glycine cleavage system protein GcvH [Legionella oakridgensis]AHE65729.1 glycine cleavage system H protein [Legionella oakridgensis ATCC 33761 = DSM 21215]ETO94453.1 glycine cleavage system H protein [Legionella oakridgensis RV-2-2007]KTD38196.1 glycine cleavage system protein H [Legionella oakridgensis]STY15674.1 glycine cleavage system H protein [Legionella longbeachae]
MNDIPKDLRFTKTHEWIKGNEEALTLGITDHAQQLLGDLVFVELPEVGNTVCAGDEIGVVESVKAASDFYAPVGGVIIAVNHKVSEDPGLVNKDPYGEGWLVKIRANNFNEVKTLLDAEQYGHEITEDN